MGGMYVPYGMETLYVPYATCLRESIGSTMFVSFDFLNPCGMEYVHLMMTLEEQFMEGWIGEHLPYGGSLTHVGVTNGGGEVCNTHLISCLTTRNILEGRTVIFPISPS